MTDDRKRVKFTGDCFDEEREDLILAQDQPGNVYIVKLGYIKIYHRYKVMFLLSNKALQNGSVRACKGGQENNRCTFVKSSDLSSGIRLECEIFAENERTFDEKLDLEVVHSEADTCKKITIVFVATVFGKHEGTPRLKRGLHCVGYEDVDSASSSDDN